MFAWGYNGDDLLDAYRDVAVLQQLYDIAEFKADCHLADGKRQLRV